MTTPTHLCTDCGSPHTVKGEDRTLRPLKVWATNVEWATNGRDTQIRHSLKDGHSIRATARAAGVSARTVQRIAERES